MKKLLLTLAIAMAVTTNVHASLDARFWPASDKAKQFVRDTVVIGMLAYNDRFRTGSGSLVAYNGKDDGLTDYGRAVIDQLVTYGIMLDLSHTGLNTAADAMAHMEENYPDIPFSFTHSLPAGLYKNEPNANAKGCYRNISDEEALRAAKSGGYVSPTFTEWMMDGIWPDDITPKHAADMIDAFNKGATDAAPLARILPAVTDELWKRGYSNEDLAKI